MSLVKTDEVVRELNLDPIVFEWDANNRVSMDSRVAAVIAQQGALIRRKVGAANYATTAEPAATCLKTGELYRCCAALLRQVANVIAYAPENVVNEVADLATIEAGIADYREQADDFLIPYYTSESEGPQVLFAIGTTGVAERQSTWRGVPTEEYEGKDEDVAHEEFLEEQ